MWSLSGLGNAVSQWWYPPVKEEVKEDVLGDVAEAVIEKIAEKAAPMADEQAPAVNARPFSERSFDEHWAYTIRQKDRVFQFYRANTAGLDSQTKTLALAKSIVDLVSFYFGFSGAMCGAILGAGMPSVMGETCQYIDRKILGGISDWSFDKKMAVMAVCSLSVIFFDRFFSLPFLEPICSIYSVKIGAELASRNYQFFQIKAQ